MSLDDLRSASAATAHRPKIAFGGLVGLRKTADGDIDSSASIGSVTSPSYGSTNASAEALLTKLHGVGGGLAGAALTGERPSRRKISRYWRLQRGTCCFRFTLLVLSVLIVFAGYFAFDLPSITADNLKNRLNIDNEQLGVLFSVYAFPNAIIPMLSGAFFSKVGKWTGVVIIASVITSGVALTGLGVFVSAYWLMVVGRVLYGLGGESVYVGVDILVTKWFKGAEVGLAYGLIQAAGQAGSFCAFYLAPPLDEAFGGIQFVYAASMVVTGGALAALAIARILEITAYGVKEVKTAARGDAGDMHHSSGVMLSSTGVMAAAVLDGNEIKKAKHTHKAEDHAHGHGKDKEAQTKHHVGGEHAALMNDVEGATNGEGAAKHIAEEDDEIFVEKYDDFELEHGDSAAELDKLSPCPGIPWLHYIWRLLGFSHLRRLKWEFWCVLGGIACYSSAFYTFLAFGNLWLMQNYGYDDNRSGQTIGIVSIFSMALSPAIGVLMDKKGGQRYAAFTAMCGACFFFAIMGFTDAPPVATVLLAGACYSVLPSSLYPLLVQTVPDDSFTAVYALVNSCINLFLTGAYYFAGYITNVKTSASDAATAPTRAMFGLHEGQEEQANFTPVFIMFCVLTGLGTVFTGLLARQQWLGHVGYTPMMSSHH
jgi:MFS family permease